MRRDEVLDTWVIHLLAFIFLLFWRLQDKDLTSQHKDVHFSIFLQRKADIRANIPT